MLPQIDFLLPESGLNVEYPPLNPTQLSDSREFVASFADLLREPTLLSQPDIDLFEGEMLPQGGNVLPPDPPLVLAEPAAKPGPPIEDLPEFSRPEVTRAAQLIARQEAEMMQRPNLPIRPDPGLRSLNLETQARTTGATTQATTVLPVDRPSPEIAYAPARRLSGIPLADALPKIELPLAVTRPQPPGDGARAAGVTTELVIARVAKAGTARPTESPLEPLEFRTSAESAKPSIPLTTAAASAGAVASTATAGASTAVADTGPLQMLTSAPHTSTVSTPAPSAMVTEINIPVRDAGWGAALNERVTWMANSNVQNAQIRMNPPELGPLRVQVLIDAGSAQVVFDAQHASTREAIELALPRLREMLAENGLHLADVSVSDQEVHQGQAGVQRDSTTETISADDSIAERDDLSGSADKPAKAKSGLIDTFV